MGSNDVMVEMVIIICLMFIYLLGMLFFFFIILIYDVLLYRWKINFCVIFYLLYVN